MKLFPMYIYAASAQVTSPEQRGLLLPECRVLSLYIYLPNSEATCMLVYILPAVYCSLIKDCLIYYITRSFSSSINVGHIAAVN